MQIFSFDIAVSSHDALKRGETALFWVHNETAADSHHDASLIALQMASIHGMPTQLLTCI